MIKKRNRKTRKESTKMMVLKKCRKMRMAMKIKKEEIRERRRMGLKHQTVETC
jgi:hypothetical protein